MRIRKSYTKSCQFVEKIDSIFHGTVAPIDSLAIKIKYSIHLSILDPGSYFCKKGFIVLTYQHVVIILSGFYQ